MDVSFSAEDREECLRQLHEQTERFGISYLAWCLMTRRRPLGTERFITRLEQQTGRLLRPRKRGPKSRS